MQDIATLTGGQVVAPRGRPPKNDQVGPRGARPGPPRRGDQDNTTIVDGAGDATEVEGRVNQIKAEIESTDPTGTVRSSRSASRLAGGVWS